jgi:hypothetical protein
MASAAQRRRATTIEVTDPQRGGYFDPLLTFRVNTRSPLPEFVSVARTGMDVRPSTPLPTRSRHAAARPLCHMR